MSDITPERIAELRRLAEAATPGPWEVVGTPEQDEWWWTAVSIETSDGDRPIAVSGKYGEVPPNAAYIVAANPQTLLALLDALEAERGLHALDHSLADRRERERDQLRAENERLRAALEAVWASGKVATEGSCYPKEPCKDCLLERQVMAALAASPEQEGQ